MKTIDVWIVEYDLFLETWVVSKMKSTMKSYLLKKAGGLYIYRNQRKANRIANKLNDIG